MIILEVIGGIVIVIGSVIVSSILTVKGVANIFTEILDYGYKISDDIDYNEAMNNIKNVTLEKVSVNGKKIPRFFANLFMILPGVNIAYAAYNNYALSNALEGSLDELIESGVIVPMDEKEVIEYSKISDDFERLMYFASLNSEDKSNNNQRTEVLFYYPLDESYHLNDIEKKSFNNYKLGIVNGEMIAIVSDEEDIPDFSKIRFCDENDIYQFEELDNSKCQDVLFKVYPYDFKTSARLLDLEVDDEKDDVYSKSALAQDLSLEDKIQLLEKIISDGSEHFSNEELSRLREDLEALKDTEESNDNYETLNAKKYSKIRREKI